MIKEYELINFDGIPSDDYVEVAELEKFIEDAEIVISDYGSAWSKDFIVGVIESHRGASLLFKDKMSTYGYNIKCKLVKSK
jgi:hypothetical protein